MQKTSLIAAAAVAALFAWWWAQSARAPDTTAAQRHSAPEDAARGIPVTSVLHVRPGAPESAGAAPAALASAASKESAAMRQFRERRDLASLYRAVEADASPEALYLRAEIYALCARTDDKSAQVRAGEQAAFRAKFITGLSQGATNADRRVDALDRLNRDACQGLDLGRIDPTTLARMIAAAAAAGDPRAQAWQLAERFERSRADPKTGARGVFNVTESDFEQVRTLLASGHAEVMQDLQGAISSTLAEGSIRLGGVAIDGEAMYQALSLLACDAGAACGPDSPVLLRECAYRGRCDAGSYYEYLFYYQTSPSEAQAIDAYRRALSAMMRSGDFSALTYAQGAGIPGFTMTFGGGRRPYFNVETAPGAALPPQTAPPPPKRGTAESA